MCLPFVLDTFQPCQRLTFPKKTFRMCSSRARRSGRRPRHHRSSIYISKFHKFDLFEKKAVRHFLSCRHLYNILYGRAMTGPVRVATFFAGNFSATHLVERPSPHAAVLGTIGVRRRPPPPPVASPNTNTRTRCVRVLFPDIRVRRANQFAARW